MELLTQMYHRILILHAKPSGKCLIGNDFIFQHDNDWPRVCHRAPGVMCGCSRFNTICTALLSKGEHGFSCKDARAGFHPPGKILISNPLLKRHK